MLVPVEDVRKLAEGILLANGVPPDHARTQAGLFIEAEMRAIIARGLPAPFEIQIRCVETIPRPGSGKHEEFVSLLDQPLADVSAR